MKQIEKVQAIANKHGWTTTKYQYAIIREIMAEKSVDVTEEEIKEICNLQRYARMVLGKDEVAEELEKEWHTSPHQRAWENEGRLFEVSKILS